jgi:hypothetical protein
MFHSTDLVEQSVVTSARVRLGLLLAMEPGAEVVGQLASIDVSGLGPDGAITYLQVVERVEGWLAAQRNAGLVAAAAPEPRIEQFTVLVPGSDQEREVRIADAAREEIAAALRWSPATAAARIDTARLLAGPLAATGAALAAGLVSGAHVAVMVEHARRLPAHLQGTTLEREVFAGACAVFQDRVLPTAARATVARTRAQANRVVLAIDAAGVQRRRRQALAARDVYVADQLDGVSVLIARMATEQAHAVLATLDATAHAAKTRGHGDADLTMGQRRVEALTEAVLETGRPGSPSAGSPPVRAQLDLVIDLPTLLALRNDLVEDDGAGDVPGASGGPVELRGAGAIPSAAVRDLLADPQVAITLRRLVIDPLTGHLLDYGRRSYPIPDPLRRFIVARDRTCRFPGCGRRADHCQIDHAIAWDDDGTTSPANLGALCVRHHQLKTHTGWDITASGSDGSCTWTSPHRRTYQHEPPPAGPIHGPPPF